MSLICIVEYENQGYPWWCKSSDEIILCPALWYRIGWFHCVSSPHTHNDHHFMGELFVTPPPHVKLFDVGVKVKKNEFPSVSVSWNSAHSPSIHSVCKLGEFNCTQQPCEVVNQCPGSLIYSPRSCLLTCTSLDPPGQQQGSGVTQWSCREPLSGCVCPQGTVLLVGEKCSSLMDYFS